MTEKDILKLIKQDKWMIKILTIVRDQNLPDWYIGAGFIRNKVWDTLHAFKTKTPLNDIDVVYFDLKNTDESKEKEIEKILNHIYPNQSWSVKNQARFKDSKGKSKYTSSSNALSHWIETATCIGIKLDSKNNLQLFTPYGIADLTGLIIRRTPGTPVSIYKSRLKEKDWLRFWPELIILT